MDAAVAMVKAGSLLTQQAGAVIIEINGGALRVLNGVQDISDAIHEQSETGREIASNVEKVAQMSEENSASVRKISTTVENIEYLTQSLEESVKHFSV
jgi:methyl-accepting chemotaxis protein